MLGFDGQNVGLKVSMSLFHFAHATVDICQRTSGVFHAGEVEVKLTYQVPIIKWCFILAAGRMALNVEVYIEGRETALNMQKFVSDLEKASWFSYIWEELSPVD